MTTTSATGALTDRFPRGSGGRVRGRRWPGVVGVRHRAGGGGAVGPHRRRLVAAAAAAALLLVSSTSVPPVTAEVAVAGGATLAGRVGAPDGSAAPGVCVTVDGNGGTYRTSTDAAGRWRVAGVGAGAAFVSFNDCEGAVPSLAASWWPGTTTPSEWHAVAVTAGSQHLALDVTLRLAARLRGTVTDTSGVPVGGACVTAVAGDHTVGRARSDAGGRYVVASLPPGTFDVMVRDCTDPATLVPGTAAGLAVAVGGARDVPDVRLRQGGAIEGTVRSRHTGAPAAGACVTLWTAEPDVGASLYRGKARSGFDPLGRVRADRGRYVLDGVAPGWYRVFFGFDHCGAEDRDDGFAELWYDGAVPPDQRPRDVEVRAGAVVTAVDAVLQATPTTSRLCPWPPPAAFSDVTVDDTHGEGIACAASVRLVTGHADRTFRPRLAVTRGQLASTVLRALVAGGVVPPARAPDAFDDDGRSVHELALDQLATMGVMRGTHPRRAEPDRAVTRGQLATVLTSAYGAIRGATLVRGHDRWTDDDGSVHEPALETVALAGLLAGTSPTAVGPTDPVTRGQLATIVSRLLDRTMRDG